MKDQIATKAEKLVRTINYDNVLIADISIVIGLFILALFWKEQRLGIFVSAIIYGTFTALWHFPPGLMSY